MDAEPEPVKNVVLVHGRFVDRSRWREVCRLLTGDGFRVGVVQNPALSLAGDVAATTERVLDALDGPAILVGHSYGGAVVTEAGNHERVAGLVYVATFVPDKGESVDTLLADPEPGAPMLPPVDGGVFLDRERFLASFEGDLPSAQAEFMTDSQVPWGSTRAAVRSVNRPGGTSRAAIRWRPTTG